MEDQDISYSLALLSYDIHRTLSSKQGALVVMPDAVWARYCYETLAFFRGTESGLYWFSNWETLPYDGFSPSPSLVAQRLRTLAELPMRRDAVVVTSVDAIRQRLCPQTHLDKFGIHVAVGDMLVQANLVHRLVQAGYRQNPIISAKGEYATRGAIVDVFPINAANPLRLEWIDDEISSIREFSLDTQLTLEKLPQVSLLPSCEIDLSDAGRVCFRQSARRVLGEKFTESAVYKSVTNKRPTQGIEYYLPLFFDETATLFDYLSPQMALIMQEDVITVVVEQHCRYCERRYQRLNALREHNLLDVSQLWLSEEELNKQFSLMPRIRPKSCAVAIKLSGSRDEREQQWWDYIRQSEKVALHFSSTGLREYWWEKLTKSRYNSATEVRYQYPTNNSLTLYISPLQYSFEADGIIHLAESHLHTTPSLPNAHKATSTVEANNLIRSLADLMIGQPVVHADYGVGRYGGLAKVDDEEMLIIDYAKGAKLYVTVTDLDRISKYSQNTTEQAPLHELGGKAWQNIKRKATESANDTAAELLSIYAAREAAEGYALKFDRGAIAEFSRSFSYEETPDQSTAIQSVLTDLEQSRPMERIICGDVGFGKTEVAMRAAYASVLAGRQVAMLVPTTLLAEQHFHSFEDRFSDIPIQIDTLSRFKNTKDQKLVLDAVASGKVDILIGTHRLLQDDVQFAQLGLVIIDEEQRFGVRHKEKLKQLRANVNMLTLTATPIPRTLNLALSGLRDISIIATPPEGRQSVLTMLIDWDPLTIEEACEREIRRGGQVFFLHNDITSITRIARLLSDILPNARIAIAHGKMRERELESIMQAFYNRHYDILLATTIIESGIDIPNANTIIINRADKLGLAQLHQLRGRVGRSHHQAYAYLITPTLTTLSKDTQRRLEAFVSLDSLGAGFLLASQDLDIRGAGEILGDEQSGQMQQIGMSYYFDLLDRATQAIKSGSAPLTDAIEPTRQIELGVTALLPENYIFDPQIRLTIYQRLANATANAEIDSLSIEVMDRFGKLPEAAQNLFVRGRLNLLAKTIGIEAILFQTQHAILRFHQHAKVNPDALNADLQRDPQRYRLRSSTVVEVQLGDIPSAEKFSQVIAWLEHIKHAD